MSISQLIEIAYNNREEVKKKERQKEKKKGGKLQAALLAVAIVGASCRGQGQGRGGSFRGNMTQGRGRSCGPRIMDNRIGPNQCAYCRKEGHWKNACPKLEKRDTTTCGGGSGT